MLILIWAKIPKCVCGWQFSSPDAGDRVLGLEFLERVINFLLLPDKGCLGQNFGLLISGKRTLIASLAPISKASA